MGKYLGLFEDPFRVDWRFVELEVPRWSAIIAVGKRI